ncbi:MAG: VWA domain-containing protein [Ignavibacteriae bacterium]|nr:VWA domain-containing protein [Ignavibacteriota bacterium]
MKRGLILPLLLLCLCTTSAQLRLEVPALDMQALPHVRMRVLLLRDGAPYAASARATWRLTQNGRPVDIEVACPDSGWFNAVALVLDNSGSMTGVSLDGLKSAAHTLVDSLRPVDETAIVTFGTGVQVTRDFTAAKDSLHRAIDTLRAGGNTPLYDAIMEALRRISLKQGRKALVVFTDGVDNASSSSFEDIRAAASAAGVRLFTIGFGGGAVSERQLQLLATETGARYFRVFGASQLREVFAAIASDLTFPGCVLTWQAPSCTDSTRFLHLEATAQGQTAMWDSVVQFPFRPDTLTLRVDAPPEVDPGGNVIAYLRLTPRVHTGLLLSFRFLFRYDAALLDIAPLLPVTVGTITQNTRVTLRALRPGTIECSAELIEPAFHTGALLGFRLTGRAADSSRPVILAIDSLEFEAGCASVVHTVPDTIDVCQCLVLAPAEVSVPVFSQGGSELTATVRYPAAFRGRPGVFHLQFRHDAHLRFLRAEGGAGDRLRWQSEGSSVRVSGAGDGSATGDSVLCRLVFAAASLPAGAHAGLLVHDARAYADCCVWNTAEISDSTSIDGYCTPLLGRASSARLGAPYPQPANGMVLLPVHMPSGQAQQIRIVLTAGDGAEVFRLHDGLLQPGTHVLRCDLVALPSGVYHIHLQSETAGETRSFRIVR